MERKEKATPETGEPETELVVDAELVEEAEVSQTGADEAVQAINEKYLRLAAEYDNYRKRTAREREGLVTDTRCAVVTQMLPILDNLERAAEQPCEDTAYVTGVQMIQRQWLELLAKMGITPIEALRQPFDPNLHDAVLHVEDSELPENTVVEEFQKGYKTEDRVLRHSIVKVAN